MGPGAQSEKVLSRCANPCVVASFFAAVQSAPAHYATVDDISVSKGETPLSHKLPRIAKVVGKSDHSIPQS